MIHNNYDYRQQQSITVDTNTDEYYGYWLLQCNSINQKIFVIALIACCEANPSLLFSCVMLKSWRWPGDEAVNNNTVVSICLARVCSSASDSSYNNDIILRLHV